MSIMGMDNSVALLGMDMAKNYGGMQLDLEFDSPEDMPEEFRPYLLRAEAVLGPKEGRPIA